MIKKNYSSMVDGKYIRLALNNGRSADYFSYNEDFLDILNTWYISVFYNNGRTQCFYWRGKWNPSADRVYLYDLVFACYAGIAHAETLKTDLQKYFEWKRTQGLTLDHLDGDTYNNTILNLSLMPLSHNIQKMMFPAGFVPPYTLNMAYVDDEYRVQLILANEQNIMQQMLDRVRPGLITLNDSGGISSLFFRYEDSESLVSCLKHLYETKFGWCNSGGTARAYKKGHREINHLTADIERSLVAQDALAQMDRSRFQVFTSGD